MYYISMFDAPSVVATSRLRNHWRDQTHREANMSLQGHFCSLFGLLLGQYLFIKHRNWLNYFNSWHQLQCKSEPAACCWTYCVETTCA